MSRRQPARSTRVRRRVRRRGPTRGAEVKRRSDDAARDGRPRPDGRQPRAPAHARRPRVRGLRREQPTRSTSSWARARRARTRSTSSSAKLEPPRAVWVMVPAAFVGDTVDGARRAPGAGRHHHRRRQLLLPRRRRPGRARCEASGIHYVDVGTSGGVFGLERGFCLMIGGEDEVVAHLDPIFATIAPGVDAAPRTPGRTGDAVDRRERLPPLRPERCRALREDGPQRHRVRDDGRVRRGPERPAATPTSASATPGPRRRDRRRCATRSTTSTTSTSPRSPRCGGAAASSRRGCSTSPRTRSRSTPTLADFAGRVSDSRRGSLDDPRRDRRGRAGPRAAARRCSTGSTSRGDADFADKLLSAMRKEFGGHDEKVDQTIGETK